MLDVGVWGRKFRFGVVPWTPGASRAYHDSEWERHCRNEASDEPILLLWFLWSLIRPQTVRCRAVESLTERGELGWSADCRWVVSIFSMEKVLNVEPQQGQNQPSASVSFWLSRGIPVTEATSVSLLACRLGVLVLFPHSIAAQKRFCFVAQALP